MYVVCLVWIFHNTQMAVRRLLLGVGFHFPLSVVRLVSELLYLLAISSALQIFFVLFHLAVILSL